MTNNSITLGNLTGWKKYNSYRILIHIAVWLIYTFVYSYIYALLYESTTLQKSLAQYTLSVWIDIAATYFTVYFLLPDYLLRKKYQNFVLWFFGAAIFFIFLQRFILLYITYPNFYPQYKNQVSFFKFNYIYSFLNIYVMPAIFASLKLFEYWFINQKRNQELEKEKMESELKFLKSQIHPHFLFNTLNNLYALTLDKSDKAPEVVVKLSDLLSYMLYECDVAETPLAKEVKLLQDYMDLEKIRYTEEIRINLDISGRINGKFIAPLILLPFVENGFKHGLSKQINQPWINITLDIDNDFLSFMVENNSPDIKIIDDNGYAEGIGLKNVRRRLDLIYGEQYTLDITNKDEIFTVKLQVKLNPHKKEK